MSTNYADLLKRRADIVSQLAPLQNELTAIDQQLSPWLAKFSELFAPSVGFPSQKHTLESQTENVIPGRILSMEEAIRHELTTSRAKRGIGKEIEQLAVEALKLSGRPLHTRELAVAIQSTGFQIPGQNPEGNLAAHLSSSKLVTRSSQGWWFQEETTSPSTEEEKGEALLINDNQNQ